MGDPLTSIWNILSDAEHTIREFSQRNKLVCKLVCGASAGVAAKSAIAPIERIKMSFQLSTEKFSLFKCYEKLISTAKQDGILKLWKGHSANIARVAPYAALHYSIHDYVESFMEKISSPSISQNKVLIQLISGSMAGGGATMVTYPLDVIRVRIAFGPSGLSFVQSWRAAFHHGGLWQGFVPTMLGVVPYSGTAWCAKGIFQSSYADFMNRPLNTTERLVLNACAGLVGQLVTYPLDVVRRRMQMVNIVDRSGSGSAVAATAKATGAGDATVDMRETMRRLYKTEGLRGLTKGYSLNVFKGPITLSISLTVYDVMQNWLKKEL